MGVFQSTVNIPADKCRSRSVVGAYSSHRRPSYILPPARFELEALLRRFVAFVPSSSSHAASPPSYFWILITQQWIVLPARGVCNSHASLATYVRTAINFKRVQSPSSSLASSSGSTAPLGSLSTLSPARIMLHCHHRNNDLDPAFPQLQSVTAFGPRGHSPSSESDLQDA